MNAACATAVVMAKAPRPGKVKTRLHPMLGPGGCARLQATLLRRVGEVVAAAGPSAIVAVSPAQTMLEVADLVPAGTTLLPQIGADLGARMRNAAGVAFAAGASAVVLLGVDAVTLTPRTVRAAVEHLDDADVVLGPACDGGYYLLALRRPLDALFDLGDRATWGGPQVLRETQAIAGRHGARVSLLPMLRDLDTPADAEALLADAALPAEVAALLRPVPVGA